MAETAERTVGVAEFLDLVENAWYSAFQGELMIANVESGLAGVALAMRQQALDNWTNTKDAVEQYDGGGKVIEDLTEQEIARRVVEAFGLLFYGGSGQQVQGVKSATDTVDAAALRRIADRLDRRGVST